MNKDIQNILSFDLENCNIEKKYLYKMFIPWIFHDYLCYAIIR